MDGVDGTWYYTQWHTCAMTSLSKVSQPLIDRCVGFLVEE